jgi:cytochrome c556
MKTGLMLVVAAAALGGAWLQSGAAVAQDAMAVISHREDVMKTQGKAMAAIKAYVEGKGDLAAARAAGAELARIAPTIPSLFPQKTSLVEYPGKTEAKPDIWADWDKFNMAVKNDEAKAAALNAALQSGDKARSGRRLPPWARKAAAAAIPCSGKRRASATSTRGRSPLLVIRGPGPRISKWRGQARP